METMRKCMMFLFALLVVSKYGLGDSSGESGNSESDSGSQAWSSCSVTCGDGEQHRTVCSSTANPDCTQTRPCNLGACPYCITPYCRSSPCTVTNPDASNTVFVSIEKIGSETCDENGWSYIYAASDYYLDITITDTSCFGYFKVCYMYI